MTNSVRRLTFHRTLLLFANRLPIIIGLLIFVSLFDPPGTAQSPASANAAPGLPTPPAAIADAKLPAFDVVSVKPNKSESGRTLINFTPDGYAATNVAPNLLIEVAYGIRRDLISGGPGWVDSARYDFEAKVAGSDLDAFKKLNRDQRRTMLQPALVDRFKLKAHTEIKQLPVYELAISKGGLKLKEATSGDTYANGIKAPDGGVGRGMMRMAPGQLTAQGIAMSDLVRSLSQQLHRTVIDKTGLTGKYDFELNWAPDQGSDPMFKGAEGLQKTDSTPESAGPSIFTAVQEQLGLKLQSASGPVETLVIDHIELPSEN